MNLKHLYVCCKTKLAILVITRVSLHLFSSLLNKKADKKNSSREKHFEDYKKHAKANNTSGDRDEDTLNE